MITPVVNAASLPPNTGTVFKYSGVRYAPVPGTVNLPLTTESGDPIPYMERGHIEVWRSTDGFKTTTVLARPAQFDFSANGTAIKLVTPSAVGEEYILRRVTPLGPYMSFADGAQLTAQQLNRLDKLNLYRDQEIYDGVASSGRGTPGDVTQVTGVAPISVASSDTTPIVSIFPATPSNAGSMSAADKAKLDGITGGGGGGGAVDTVTGQAPITVGGTATNPVVGITAATTGAAGSMSGADKAKLDGIATGATKSDLDYTAASRTITNTGGNPAVLPLFGTAAGLVPGTPSGTVNFLRADGTWAPPPVSGGTGPTDLGYVAATRLLTISTGVDVNLPLVTTTEAGLVPATGGGKIGRASCRERV